MFEFVTRTAIDRISTTQSLIYYGILAALFFLFLRVRRTDKITLVILLVYFHGFFLAFGTRGFVVFKIVLTLATLNLYFGRGRFPASVFDSRLLLSFGIFTLLHFAVWFLHTGPRLAALNDYYKYLIPFLIFVGVRKHPHWKADYLFYVVLIIKLTAFQILFSFVKLAVLGFRENIIGTVGSTGGSVSIAYAVFPALMYWMYSGEVIKRKDLWYLLLLLAIPIASNKRAIWLTYPLLMMAMTSKHIERKTLNKFAYLLILVPLIFYFGLRFNPSFNPERAIWGSFDPQFAWSFIKGYSLGEEKDTKGLAYGRVAAAQHILTNTVQNPLDINSIFGYGIGMSGASSEMSNEDLGLWGGTIAAAGFLTKNHGYLYTISIIVLIWTMTSCIADGYNRRIFRLLFLWNLFFYSGGFFLTPQQSIIMYFAIMYAERKSQDSGQITSNKPIFVF